MRNTHKHITIIPQTSLQYTHWFRNAVSLNLGKGTVFEGDIIVD